MSEWQEFKLGELVEIGSSKRVFYEDYVNVGVPFYRSKEIIEKHNGNNISTDLFITKEKFEQIKEKYGAPKAGDLLLTSVGTLGIPYIVEEDEEFYFKDGNLTWFKNYKNNLYNQFLYYWIVSPIGKNALDMMSIGSTQAALTIQGLKNLDFIVPPIEEQKVIALVLSSLDDKIDLLHRQNTTLEAMAETLFRQWFVEEAQADWITTKLGEILSCIESGSRPKGGIDPDLQFGIPSIGAENINGLGKYMHSKTKFITNEFFQSMKRGVIQDFDVLVYKDGAYVGRKAMFGKGYPFDVCSVNEHVFILRGNEKINQFFLYFLLQEEDLALLNTNSAQPGLNQESMKSFEILLPPINLINDFAEVVSPSINKIFQNGIQIRTLEKLRDTLLPKLMSGEIRIQDD